MTETSLTMKAIAWALSLSPSAPMLTVLLAVVLFAITTLANPVVRGPAPAPRAASAVGLPQPGSPRQASLHNPPTEIPAAVLALYEAAATRYGVAWTLLAGVGMEETNHGRNNCDLQPPAPADTARSSCRPPSTFYGVDGNGDGRPVITDDADSVHSAANYLVASGALTGADGVRKALFAYNHALWYVNDVLYYAAAYSGGDVAENPCVTDDTDTTGTPLTGTGPATDAVNAALRWLGTRYRLGRRHPERTLNRDLLLTRRPGRTRRHRVRLLRPRPVRLRPDRRPSATPGPRHHLQLRRPANP